MISLEYSCVSSNCENGQININSFRPKEDSVYITCNACSGTGKRIVNVSCLITREVNMGDHGETRINVLDVPQDITLQEFLLALYNPADYTYHNLINVLFSADAAFQYYNADKEKSPF